MAATTLAPILDLLGMIIKDHSPEHLDAAEIATEALACLDPNQLSPEPVRFLCREMLRHLAQTLAIPRAHGSHIAPRDIDLERGL
jgi:hypothetical protein